MPPEAPTEGQNSNLSNRLGAKFRMNCKPIASLLVSCRQKMLAQLSSILFLIGSHLSLSFKPRMFQHKTFQARLTIIDKRKRENKRLWGATTTENHNRQPSFNQHPRIHKTAAKFKRPPGAETNIKPPGAKSFPIIPDY
jgi:hypothetical protein